VSASNPRHIDPKTLELEDPSGIQLFSLYGYIFDLIGIRNFSAAINLIDLTREVYMTELVEGDLSKYNNLLEETVIKLGLTDEEIKQAYYFLKWFNEESANNSKENALEYLLEVSQVIKNLDEKSRVLGSLLRTPPSELLEGIEILNKLTREYQLELSQIEDMITDVNSIIKPDIIGNLNNLTQTVPISNISQIIQWGLLKTQLTLTLEDSEVIIGESVKLSGVLSTLNSTGIVGRSIELYIDNKKLGRTVTDKDGRYTFELEVPYIYKESVNLYSQFNPTNRDMEIFTPSTSKVLKLYLSYITPVIDVDVPLTAFPGRFLKIIGKILKINSLSENIQIQSGYFGQTQVTETDSNGKFSFELFTPENVEDGNTVVQFKTLPYEIYGPSTIAKELQIIHEKLDFEIEAPSWIITGRQTKIKGKVFALGKPLARCSVLFSSDWGTATSSTSNNGVFELSLTPSIMLVSSNTEYELLLNPIEPWIEKKLIKSQFYLVNLYSLLTVPLLFGCIFFIGYKKYSRNEEQEDLDKQILTPEVKLDFKEYTINIMVRIYQDAINIIQRITGNKIQSSQTIREYLKTVRKNLNRRFFRSFERISLAYERWLYDQKKNLPIYRTRMRRYYAEIENEEGEDKNK
jgi:hypothetical protein